MLILGKIQDSFDHMPFVYGVDNKIILDKRKYFDLPSIEISTIDYNSFSAHAVFKSIKGIHTKYLINNTEWKYNWRVKEPIYKFCSLFYCGKAYLLARKYQHDSYTLIDPTYYFVANPNNPDTPYYINARPELLAYSEDNNIPFFIYKINKNNGSVDVDPVKNYIPLCSIKGGDVFLNVDKVYNEIYNYMMSLKNDKNCVEVSNKDKILQAGFDLKTSFRNC